jgi:hypothetical protein
MLDNVELVVMTAKGFSPFRLLAGHHSLLHAVRLCYMFRVGCGSRYLETLIDRPVFRV